MTTTPRLDSDGGCTTIQTRGATVYKQTRHNNIVWQRRAVKTFGGSILPATSETLNTFHGGYWQNCDKANSLSRQTRWRWV